MENEMRIKDDKRWLLAHYKKVVLADRIKRMTVEVKGEESERPTNAGKQFPQLRKPVEQITADLEALDAEEERLEFEKELNARMVAFREIYEAWMSRDTTLGDMLTAMMASGLCNRINPFR